jgi:hypothetical protein
MTMRAVVSLDEESPESSDRSALPRLGTISRCDETAIAVEFAGSAGPTEARALATLGEDILRHTFTSGMPVLLLFENGDLRRPIIVGVVAGGPPWRESQSAVSVVASVSQTRPVRVVEADVDGQRVRIVAKDEIVLECGEASITLRRNGKVVVRGTYVESHSTGTNRLKGGQVRIN